MEKKNNKKRIRIYSLKETIFAEDYKITFLVDKWQLNELLEKIEEINTKK